MCLASDDEQEMSEETSAFKGFIQELKRRKVFRVAAAYVVGAWLLMQIAETTFGPLNLPEWSITLVLWLLILGFPVAVFLAWAPELTPEGVKREEQRPDTTEASTPAADKAGDEPSIAVLPFADMSAEKDQDHFCEGMAEEIINALTKMRHVHVASRTGSFQFKGTQTDIAAIGGFNPNKYLSGPPPPQPVYQFSAPQ